MDLDDIKMIKEALDNLERIANAVERIADNQQNTTEEKDND